jgi:hypothetical protein
MNIPEYLIKNVDNVIGRVARASKSFKELPREIRVSKEAKQVFIDRMQKYAVFDLHINKPLTLFGVPIVYQPGLGKYVFLVDWNNIGKMLRRRDHKF